MNMYSLLNFFYKKNWKLKKRKLKQTSSFGILKTQKIREK